MFELEQVVDELEKLNLQTARLFRETVSRIDCTEEIKLDWAKQCLLIASSGWHAFESTNTFIDISESICTNYGADDLLRRGAYGVQLSGYSFEPGSTYFSGLRDLLNSQGRDKKWQQLEYIEDAGLTIHKKYQHASNLITDYFRAAFGIILRDDFIHGRDVKNSGIQAWSQLAASISVFDRGEIIQFLKLSDLHVPWSNVKTLQEKSISACLQLIAVYPQLEKKYGREFIQDLQSQFVSYAATDQPLGPYLDALLKVEAQNRRDLKGLLILLPGIQDVRLATSLVKNCHRLPLDNHQLVHQWFEVGLSIADKNVEAGLAFFELESSTSIALLEKLKGQVNYSDCKRVLQLYAEAITGRNIRLRSLEDFDSAEECLSTEDQQEDYRDLPVSDGLSIRLPDSVSRYPTVRENFCFYKIALLHQLGYFEFDTFDRIEIIEQELAAYQDQRLARILFRILEDARIDWRLEKRFRGAAKDICFLKKRALSDRGGNLVSRRALLLEVLVRYGLGDNDHHFVSESDRAQARLLCDLLERLNLKTAEPEDTLVVLKACYQIVSTELVSSGFDDLTPEEQALLNDEFPEPISFHGEMDTGEIALNLLELEESLVTSAEEDTLSLTSPINPDDLDIQELKKGDVKDALGMLVTDLENREVDLDEAGDERKAVADLKPMSGKVSRQVREEFRFLYDEWDYVIEDYRRRWCTLYEIRDLEEEPEYVRDTLYEHRDLANKVRKQLNKLKPELLRKVKGMPDGDDMDLERTVEAVVDRKMGISPSENIYVQRQRKDRDVSALFLLDMSASTDDLIPDPDTEPEFKPEDQDDDDFLSTFYAREDAREKNGSESKEQTGKRIIDLEKESVILMAEALEELGDSYSICGFSGYGRERVDYFLCKDFKDPYDHRAKGKIGGIKPCRSTRMGPAIRHATRSLVKTESRIKAMIIISDGYPQDFDYGKDRNSRDYGIRDTTMALNEARQQGVQTFCLTVDPSGHDYLREMCPDKQYMVIQDIAQLPDELSKVYRSLTG